MGNSTSHEELTAVRLPERVIALISTFVSARDVLSVGASCSLLRHVCLNSKIWRLKCLAVGWGGRVSSVRPVWKKWKQIFIHYTLLQRQRKRALQNVDKFAQSGKGVKQGARRNRTMRLLFLGLNQAGKTCILYRLKLGEVIISIPTVGYNKEKWVRRSSTLARDKHYTIRDIGGIQPMRHLWHKYFDSNKIDALVYVVDSHDQARLYEAGVELFRGFGLFSSPKPVLVFSNKFDLPHSASAYQTYKKIKIKKLAHGGGSGKGRSKAASFEWCVQSCSVKTGAGLEEGLDWLEQCIYKQHPNGGNECCWCLAKATSDDHVQLSECVNCAQKFCQAPTCSIFSKKKRFFCTVCFYCTRAQEKEKK